MSVRLLQLTDFHVGAPWAPDALARLRAVIAAVHALPDRPEAALLTGDLADSGAPAHYAELIPVLEELALPLIVLPGNHDERGALRDAFGLPGSGSEPICHAAEVGELRVLTLDTVIPGEDGGELGAARLAWLASALAEAPHTPTLLALHHPPFLCGMPQMDAIALARDDCAALSELLDGHPQVRGLVAGHTHRTIHAAFAGRPALTIAATSRQLPLAFTGEHSMVDEPLAFAVHTLVAGRLVSHVQTLPWPGSEL